MSIKNQSDLEALKYIGRVARATLTTLKANTKAGVKTIELDNIAEGIFKKHGIRSAPKIIYGFPKTVLISINDEAVHGIPNERIIKAGDVVKLDVTPELNGYIVDTAITVLIPPVQPHLKRLSDCADQTLKKAINLAQAGCRINKIGHNIEKEVKKQGFNVIPTLAGHGVGKSIHEEPEIPNVYDWRLRQRLKEGAVITIEPIITTGKGQVYKAKDGWTVKTKDRSPVAHFEHTLIIQKDAPPLVITA